MSNLKKLLWLVFVMLGAIHTSAQTINKLSINTVPSSAGKVIQVPIQLENTDEIVAIQFDITYQNGISILNEILSSNRWDDHVGVVKNIGNGRSRVMVYSPTNKPLKGNSGNILMLNAHISETCVEGEEYPAELHDVALTKGNGDNCVTATQNGKFVILKSPDLIPEFVSLDKTVVNPLDTIKCSWKVRNIGGVPTTGGFKEQVFAISEDGKNQILIGSQYSDNPIPTQGESHHSMNVTIPEIPGIDGNCLLMVKIIPDSDCGEPQSMSGNNTCKSDQHINFLKRLYLEDIKAYVDETESRPLKYKLTRSGSTLKDETFTFNIVGTDSRATFPSTLTIPRNQSSAYFYVTIEANGKTDESDNIAFSISGNEYPEISSALFITDDTFPQLKLTLSKDEVSEGDNFDLSIELPKSFASDKTIFLSSDNSGKIKVPTDVTIPSGQSSISIPLSVIDNDDAELETVVTIAATAEGLEREDCEIVVLDNDMPSLSLTLSPSEVNENSGTSAIIATVKRLSNVDKNVKLLLMEDSDGAIELSHKTLSMSKGQESVQFFVDIKDNNMVDGDKRYTITAAVYSSACNCYASELSGGAVSQELVVLDDDGPSLSISTAAQSFLEGTSDNVITISRNTSTEAAITVNISSDKDELLDYNHIVTIPAGSVSADVKISVLSNDKSGDGDIVSFKAESSGMTSGSCWVVLTDQTLPDATIELQVPQESPSAGEYIDLIVTISNIGNAPLQRNTPIDINCTSIKGAKRVYTKKAIEKGETDRLVIEDFKLPDKTGYVTISAIINDNESVSELLYSNNSAKNVELMLTPAFSVTASVDKNIYVQEEDVIITGHASGESGKNAKIEIHLSDNGTRQILNTTTDDNGDYSYTYRLLARQTGHFTVGACYPTSTPEEQSAIFDVYGLQTNKSFITCEPGLGETFNGSFRLSNPGNMSQSSITIEKISTPTNCELQIESPSVIGAGETVDVKFSLKGTGLSLGRDFEKIPLNITSAEGAKATFILYYYVQSLHGKLYTSTPTISTTMLKNTPRDYPLVIRNIGKGETGKITFALPSWVEAVTPREMASLTSGDSATIVLRFNPMDEMKLNVATKGKLGINCKNGDGISVSFDIMPVSEAIGKLKVDVVDEFTFYTAESPHVSNALIKITHPTSKEIIAEGRTGNDGIFTTEIQEGWYIMSVEADNHDIYTENIVISPGTELSKEVFMPYQAITYNWTVEETEIDDEYVFETTVDFDTRVPKPVIVISLPDEKPEPYSVIPVKITNKGLINAVNIEMSLEVSEGYTLEFLNDPTAEVLAPQQTLVFYAKLIPAESTSEARLKAPRASSECRWIISIAKYQELCQKYTGDQFVRMLKKYGKKSCFSSGDGNGGSGGDGGGYGGSGGGPGRPGSRGGSSYGSDYYVIDWSNPEKYCDRKPDDNPQDGDINSDDNDGTTDSEPMSPEGEPDEIDDCDEIPVFKFNITEVDSRKIRNGVAADGETQLRISIDPSSRIPKEDCGYVYWWEVVDNIGSITEENQFNVIYTPPTDFPIEAVPSKTITVKFYYQKGDQDACCVSNEFELVRVPCALIHGLKDSSECWEPFRNHLINSKLYDGYQVISFDYSAHNNSHFSENYNRINKAYDKLKNAYLSDGRKYAFKKIDLIGHSMGGIISRFHVQKFGKEKIHKLITVNTPHAGSEFGDIVAHDPILAFWTRRLGYNPSDAVLDLAVESEAINSDLNNSDSYSNGFGLPVFAITTESTLGTIGGTVLLHTLGRLISLYNHSLEYLQLFPGDFIVATESQQGGCSATKHFTGANHVQSPKDSRVWDQLKILLTTDASNTIFSNNWFNPTKRTFHQIILSAPKKKVSSLIDEYNNSKSIISAELIDRNIKISIDASDNSESLIIVDFPGKEPWSSNAINVDCPVPSTFKGNATVFSMVRKQNEVLIDSICVNVPNYKTVPHNIYSDEIRFEKGDTITIRVNCEWEDGTITTESDVELDSESPIIQIHNNKIIGVKTGKTYILVKFLGLETKIPVSIFNFQKTSSSGDDSDAICSTVTLSFKQNAVMTRQAFRGIFSLNNGHQTATLQDFKLNLEVKDEDGVMATKREFEITPEKLVGFQGNLDFNSGWSLEPSHNGEASILFIPTKYAALTEAKEYSFGGTFSYIDPYTGLTVTRTLNPVTLTVNPSPQLELTYFMQRDVFGDNPLTEEIEPMKPAEFALLLNNVGAGDATSLKLTTGQPQIVSNEKGLYINFELLSTQLNGGEQSLMLGGSAVTDFGSLKSGEQSYAQWWLQSSLLGHFVKYDVKATHVTSHDNPDLSLVDTVTIHELIHGFDLNVGDVKRRAFLVNDIADALDTPDQLYFTNGTQADVVLSSDASISKQNDLEYILDVSASAPGWNYGSITDPTHGRQNLSSIKRMSDGTELAGDNFWQTDFTLRDGKDPLAENLLHFIDNFLAGSESYTLTFTPKPDIELAVDSIIGLPDEDEILTEQLRTLTVRFNKPIEPTSFTVEDLSLTCQGERIALSSVSLAPMNDVDYMIDLTPVTIENGFYVLQIQTSSISDTEGFTGITGKSASWIQYVDGKVKISIVATPTEGGSVTPSSGLYDYDSTVTFNAVPADGYNFLGWWCGDDLISEIPEMQITVTEDQNYVARFALKQFNFTIDCNGEGGYVEGTSTGIYDYGQILRLEAIPYYGWAFSHWTVKGADITDNSNILELTLNRDTEIYATFVSHIEEHVLQLHNGWNWISSIFDDKDLYDPLQYFKSIKPSLVEVRAKNGNLQLNNGIFESSFDRMIPGTYKIKVNNSTFLRLKGATVSKEDYEICLSSGWNWLPYIPAIEQNISDALVNHVAIENDVIKSHTQFAIFSDGRWFGSLQTFVPDNGYMYYTTEPSSFKYSTNTVQSIAELNDNNVQWHYNERGFADNKSIVAKVLDNGKAMEKEDYIVGAFCGEECRGIGEYIDGYIFITVHGQEGDNITFKAMNNESGSEINIHESLTFDENHLGTVNNPFNLNIDKSSGINEVLIGYGLKVSPNPVKDIMYIIGDVSDVKSVTVIAMSGLTLISTDSFEHGVNVTTIPDGVYVAAILTTHGITYRKFVKKGY